jgi:4-hydroxy-tetrahydrodipicolinate synthase
MLTPFKADKSIDWKALDALTDWYLANGADGLFACCLSSEVYFLSEEERFAVTARVLKRAGKIPVIAGGVPSRDPVPAAAFAAKLTDLGVQAVVLTVCQMADKQDSDSAWQSNTEAVMAATGKTPLGLYEAPQPYKRLLTPELMRWAATSGRFVFEKDTSCDIKAIRAKLEAVRGTPLLVLNAHSPILVQAVHDGGHGFCGIAANAYPQLCSWMLRHRIERPEQTEVVQEFVRSNEPLLSRKYPGSAKILAHLTGIPIEPVCRSKELVFTAEHIEQLQNLRRDSKSDLGRQSKSYSANGRAVEPGDRAVFGSALVRVRAPWTQAGWFPQPLLSCHSHTLSV